MSVSISPGCSGINIICTNMFYMSVNKRGELVEAMMVTYKLYIG